MKKRKVATLLAIGLVVLCAKGYGASYPLELSVVDKNRTCSSMNTLTPVGNISCC
jgi:hypothetical protein